MNAFLKPGVSEKEDGWCCSHCNKKQNTFKTSFISCAPNVLFLQVKRFLPTTAGVYVKDCTKVEVNPQICVPVTDPATNLNINTCFKLISTIDHTGEFEAGHYIACVQHGGGWHHCNDSVVYNVQHTAIDPESVCVGVQKVSIENSLINEE